MSESGSASVHSTRLQEPTEYGARNIALANWHVRKLASPGLCPGHHLERSIENWLCSSVGLLRVSPIRAELRRSCEQLREWIWQGVPGLHKSLRWPASEDASSGACALFGTATIVFIGHSDPVHDRAAGGRSSLELKRLCHARGASLYQERATVGTRLVQAPLSLAWFCPSSRSGLQAIDQRRRGHTACARWIASCPAA